MKIFFYVYSFLLGTVAGSFFGVCVERLPRGQSVIRPRSHCKCCDRQLLAAELVPVFSFLMLRGACRGCGARIPRRFLVIELLSGGLYLLGAVRLGLSVKLALYFVLCSVLLIVAFVDMETQQIHHSLLYILLGIGGCSVFMRAPWWDALLGGCLGGGFFAAVNLLSHVVIHKEGIGWGDVKLMAGCGLFLGVKLTAIALFIAMMTGGCVAAVLLLHKKKRRGDRIALAPMLALGTLASFLFGHAMYDWYLRLFFLA